MSTAPSHHPVAEARPGAAPPAGPSPAVASPAGAAGGVPQLFRGRTLEALLPQVRAALGPDAIVLRRREGLAGGVGGFFQQRFVEVEAVAGRPTGFDAYDDAPAWPEDVSADGVRWLDDGAAGGPPTRLPADVGPAAPAPPVARPAAPAPVAVPAAAAQDPAALVAPFLAAAAAGTPVDGAAFLRHLDEAVERRTALAPGATDEPFEDEPAARGLLAREELDPVPVGGRAPETPGVAATPARPRNVPAGPSAPVVATFPRVVLAGDPTVDPASRTTGPAGVLGRRTAVPAAAPVPPAPAAAGPDAAPAGLAGPPEFAPTAPRPAAPRPAAPSPTALRPDGPRPAASRPAPHRPDVEVAVPERSTVDADVAEYGLIARGLSPAVARSVVLEAVAHGQPLDPGHRIDRATRAALARRIPQTVPRAGVRTMAVVGAPGAGRTAAVGALAAAHAGAGRRVLAVAMGAADGGAALAATLVGTDAELLVVTGGATAAAAIRVARPDLCVVDTPAVHPSDSASVEALAAELRTLGADEVHLALPGTDRATAALAAVDGLEALRPDALLMTHRDRAERPGGVVGAAIVRGLPIAYVTDGRGIALAEPARIARMVQP